MVMIDAGSKTNLAEVFSDQKVHLRHGLDEAAERPVWSAQKPDRCGFFVFGALCLLFANPGFVPVAIAFGLVIVLFIAFICWPRNGK